MLDCDLWRLWGDMGLHSPFQQMGLISYLQSVKSPRERFHEYIQGNREKWRSYNRPQKVLWVMQATTHSLAVLVLVMMMLVDSMSVLIQLRVFTWVWAGIAFSHYLLARATEKRWFRSAEAKGAAGLEEESVEPGWKAHGIIFAGYYFVSWLPFTGMLKVLVNLFAASSFYALLRLPFIKDLFLEMYPIFWTAFAFLLTAFGYAHWMIGVPVVITLGSWSARVIYREHLARKQNGREDLGRRVRISILSLGTFLVLSVFTGWWVMSSANVFWMLRNQPLRSSLYTSLSPDSVAKFTHVTDSCTSNTAIVRDLKGYFYVHPGMTGRVRQSRCSGRSAAIISGNEQLKSKIRRWPTELVFCEYPATAQEATVFYYRYPYLSTGTVKSLGYDMQVLGKTETHFIPGTADMSRFFDKALEKIPEFSGGLFEVILLDGIDGAKEGKGIQIVDVEAFPVGSPDEAFNKADGVFQAAMKSSKRIRTGLMQIWLGIYNIMAGNQCNILSLIFYFPHLVSRVMSCGSGNMQCLLGKP